MSCFKSKQPKEASHDSFFEYSAEEAGTGKKVDFSKFKGNVVLVSNVASAAKETKRSYDEFAQLVRAFRGQKFTLVLFPSNQFYCSETGEGPQPDEMRRWSNGAIDADMIACDQFNVMKKGDVKGSKAHPAFDFLLAGTGMNTVPNNFSKWLVMPDGTVSKHEPVNVFPLQMQEDIAKAIPQ